MDEKTYEVVISTLVEKIRDLKTELYFKNYRVKELEEMLGQTEENNAED